MKCRACWIVGIWWGGLVTGAAPVSAVNVTFFFASDLHFGWTTNTENNQAQIQAMNGIPGIAYPGSIGGTVDMPSGVVLTGDLTNSGAASEWVDFKSHYGLNGGDGLLNFPVFELSGNHDSDLVRDDIVLRHGRLNYFWDWGPVHFVSLDVHPTLAYSEWLGNHLAGIGPDRPVVLCHHYGFDSFSLDWWTQAERDAYAAAIAGYNVIAILSGHWHPSQHYTWQGYDIYSPGSCKGSAYNSFLALRITDNALAVGQYRWTKNGSGQWNGGSWGWTYTKAITVPTDPLSYCGTIAGGGPNRRVVDASAAAGGDGASWATAYTDLQDALDDAALSGNAVGEIWVAAGTYKPDRGTGNRSETYQMLSGVSIYGGFPPGGGDGTFAARDAMTFVTELSGDLLGDDGIGGNNAENSYHVVTACGVDASALLDGFVISGGNGDGTGADGRGGGLLNLSGSQPMIVDCRFEGNSARYGGGMSNFAGAPAVSNCVFSQNQALGDPISDGGGLFDFEGNSSVIGCTFTGNTAVDTGGGVYAQDGNVTLSGNSYSQNVAGGDGGGIGLLDGLDPVTNETLTQNSAGNRGGGVYARSTGGWSVAGLTILGNDAVDGGGIFFENGPVSVADCRFLGNTASDAGAGLHLLEAQGVVTNCVFSGNVASVRGGGMFYRNLFAASDYVVTNCTFSGNVGAGTTFIQGGGGLFADRGASTMTNCIFWGNSDGNGVSEVAQIRRNLWGTITVNSGCVQGWSGLYPGTGSIGSDPVFADADGGDNVSGTADDDVRLSAGSPCIDTGDNTAPSLPVLDLDGKARVIDGDGNGAAVVDMGAYEYSVGIGGNPADLDGDGDVDGNDFLTFSNCFNGALNPPLPVCGNLDADLDLDGDVDGNDFLTFSNCFNGSLNPPACP